MTKKRRYLSTAAILLACVGIALVALAMLPPRPGVTKAHFDRIEVGMTEADAREMLGQPAWENAVAGMAIWDANSHNGARIAIAFENDKVLVKSFRESTETIPDKLRRWLHLPKAAPGTTPWSP